MNEGTAYQEHKNRYKSDSGVLVQEFNSGNQFAFRFVFELYYRAAVLVAEGILAGNEAEAEDLVQDAFIKLWNHDEAFLEVSSLKSYVYTTVKNACVDKLRRSQVVRKYETHAVHHHQLAESDFTEPLITAETIRIINNAIEALPEQGRNVFKMSLAGLKNHEIAQQLSISVNTVKTHKQRALSNLRISLGDAMFILLLLHHNHLLK
ncbi:RNA polymerase sigma-70 factor [Pedobacter endophyticus]|uniref:RNA polymerase sigma-70 factor n=1 Tax=Pedobacter endophyticus TaxID=2789740 RepID=A0A7S9Q0K8_9SPHI|nr:RNA polymerase sigma-70 factor [Pedobacter endophyticus]QPH41483.1 RNA polymerase sigma-70 factor [Pedobacter endophyticus]